VNLARDPEESGSVKSHVRPRREEGEGTDVWGAGVSGCRGGSRVSAVQGEKRGGEGRGSRGMLGRAASWSARVG